MQVARIEVEQPERSSRLVGLAPRLLLAFALHNVSDRIEVAPHQHKAPCVIIEVRSWRIIFERLARDLVSYPPRAEFAGDPYWHINSMNLRFVDLDIGQSHRPSSLS